MTQPTTTATIKRGHYWRNQAIIRQGIIDKLDRRVADQAATLMLQTHAMATQAQTIEELTASVVQLENDYDAVETELEVIEASR